MSVSSFSIKQVRSAASVSDSVHVFMFMTGFDCKLPRLVFVEDLGLSILVGFFLCVVFYTINPKSIYLNCVFVIISVNIISSDFTGCINLREFSQQRALHHHTQGSYENILCQ